MVARHLIERGEIITRDNLSVVQMRGDLIQDLLSNPRNSLMTNLDEIVGQSAQCRLTSFQPIYLHMIDNSLADPMTIGCGTIPRQIPLTQFRTIGIPLAIGQTGRLFVEVPIGDEVLMLPVVNETEIVALDDAQVTVRVRDNSTTASIIGLVLENGGVLTLSWYPPNEISYFEAFDS
ncbi:MAG: SAF domain-containing protein [Chloroflexota bacterium]